MFVYPLVILIVVRVPALIIILEWIAQMIWLPEIHRTILLENNVAKLSCLLGICKYCYRCVSRHCLYLIYADPIRTIQSIILIPPALLQHHPPQCEDRTSECIMSDECVTDPRMIHKYTLSLRGHHIR
jgi:hypothetical protein